ncbi:MAG: flagellin [Selenomonadaceae bacterium]|nr:flagellin [Selenomonadaceae bacterium]
MAMVVKNNMSAIHTLNTLNQNSSALTKSLAKVSSGMKINTAQDDASGYAISERMRVQIRSLDQANQNTQNDLSMMKTAEGAVSSTIEILKSLKEKAINAANDSNTDSDRQTIQKEMDQFIDQIDDNALTTFNGKYLVDGSKNYRSESGTKTAFTNQALATNTTAGSTLTSLKNRNGESLEITSTDRITASFVKCGVTYTTTFKVGDNGSGADSVNTLNDVFRKLNMVAGTVAFGSANFSSTVNTTGTRSTPHAVEGESNAASTIPGSSDATDTLVHNGVMIGTNAAGDAVKTADGTTGLTVSANTRGYGDKGGQIAGVNISVTDSQGNVKKAANAALDAFKLSIRETNANPNDNSLNFHVGAGANQAIKVGLTDMRSEALGLKGSDGTKLSIATKDKANAAVNVLDNALQKAIDQQTDIGAIESRLDYTSSNLTTSSENVQNAESTIRDADMAKEMTNYTKNNVLLQAAQSMLAQANQNSSAVLSLLQ